MPIDANAFDTQDASAQYVNPEYWSNKLVKALKEKTFMEQFAVKDYRGLGKHNSSIKIPKNAYGEAAEITEGQEIPVSALSYEQVEITFKWYGAAHQVTLQELQSSFEFVMDDVVDRLSTALAVTKEKNIINALVNNAGTVVYANGTDAGSITVDDTLDIDDIIELQRQMRLKNATPKYLIIHPSQEAHMKKILVQNGSIMLQEGVATINGYELGRILGMKVYSSNYITTAQEGAGSDVDVAKAICLDDGAFAIAYQQEAKLQKGAPNARSLWIDFAAFEAYGIGVLDSNKVALLVSAIS